MDEPYGAGVVLGCAIDVKVLCAENIFASQFHYPEAFHEFRRVCRVEFCSEESSVPARLLDHRSGCDEHKAGRFFATAIEYAGRH